MRRAIGFLGRVLLFLTIAACCAIIVVPRFLDAIYYQGPVSAHFNGQRFFNPDGDDVLTVPTKTSRTNFLFRYLIGTDGRPEWPETITVTPAKPEARVMGERMVVTWVGHASVLVQTQGLNILTDPIWANAAGPFGIGPQRVAEPGIRFNDLPKIDIVLVSHNHYDHMDVATLKKLWDRDTPRIISSLGNDAVMTGMTSVTRDWGGRVPVRPGIDVIVTRNHHWGSRWFSDRSRALWSSFVVTLPGGNLFFAGDTGFGDGQWPAEARAYGPIRLALLPIGAFRFVPGQLSIGSHIGPPQSAEVFARLGAAHAIGIHWGTFRLSYEAYDTPPKLLAEVMKCRGMTGFGTVAIGVPTAIGPYAPPVLPKAAMAGCLNSPAMDALK
jgi:L-ascorbate metabolism protein UlaG (beta-lactamase superfamily)